MATVLNSSMNSTSSSSSPGVPEGARRASKGTPGDAAPPDPEVVATARRRQYPGSEKRALLAEADRHKSAGTLGAFLRSKRIYSSMLSSWRKSSGPRTRWPWRRNSVDRSPTRRPGRSSGSIARTPVCAASSSTRS